MKHHIAFIGGGNMASAILGGLLKQGVTASQLTVVEPHAEARERLLTEFGLKAIAVGDASLSNADAVVWAVKPQTFREAAQAVSAWTGQALHLSVAAGIRSDAIARWLGTERIVRAMPNTPALVGQGMSGLFARPAVSAADRDTVVGVLQSTGQTLWLDRESDLDIVTALSGSGPAYVFYVMEAMVRAGADMGLSTDQARQLAVGTFVGASALAAASTEPLSLLRERVTSKGGTTYAALTTMDRLGVSDSFVTAMRAAQQRAVELGDEFGRDTT